MPKTPITRVLSARKQGRGRSFRSRSVSVVISIIVCLSFLVVALIPVAEAAPDGWSDDQRLTNNSTNDDRVVIDAEGDRIHLAWHHTVTAGSDYQIFYMNSSDGGWSWSNPQQISTSNLEGHNPDIGVNDTNVHIVWEDTKSDAREIYYRNSTDGGLNWNNERRLSEDDGYDSNAPSISVAGDEIHVAWTDTRHSGAEVYYIRSLDGGVTWEDGQGGEYGRRLTDTAGDSIVYDIVKEGNTIHLIYDDSTDGDGDVYYLVSYDNGANWQPGVEIAGDSNDQAPAALAVNGSTVHVVWIERVSTSEYNIWYRNSTDNGNNWNPSIMIVGPSVYADRPSVDCNSTHVWITWMDERDDGNTNEIYYKYSVNKGSTWSMDIRLTFNEGNESYWPKIVVESENIHVVWFDDRDGNYEIYYKRSPDFIDVPEFSTIIIPIALTLVTYGMISKYIKRRRKNE